MASPALRATARLAGTVVTMKFFMRMFESVEARGPGVSVETELSRCRKRQIELKRETELDMVP